MFKWAGGVRRGVVLGSILLFTLAAAWALGAENAAALPGYMRCRAAVDSLEKSMDVAQWQVNKLNARLNETTGAIRRLRVVRRAR